MTNYVAPYMYCYICKPILPFQTKHYMKKYIFNLSITLCIGLHFGALAQKHMSSEVLIKRYSHLAEKSFKSGNYSKSIVYHELLDSLIPNSPEIKYNIGICYLNSNYKYKALPYLEFASKKKLPNKDLHYMLAQAYHHNHKFEKAKTTFKQYLKEIKNDTVGDPQIVKDINRRIEICDFAKEIKDDSIPVEIENMGPSINTSSDEYVPIVSADQQTMYFTSRRFTDNNHRLSYDGRYYEDVYLAEKDSLGYWKKARDAGHPINGPEHDACIGMTADAQTIFIYRVKSVEQFKGNILYSKLNGKEWSKPAKLGTHINTKKGWEASVSISEDNHRLYFSSDKPGGQGGLDIWYCDLMPNNEWGEPKNLGPKINTKYDEDCPFIHFDDKTLFFSSNGHKTMGGFDVFSTVLNKDSNTWASPRNLGYPINSTDDDLYFMYSADGSKGYMSTSLRNDNYGERDLYVVNRPKHSKHMIILNGKILDESNNMPVDATITVTNLETNQVEGVFSNNSHTGKYVVALDYGKNYSIQFESPNFIFYSENVNVTDPEAIFNERKDFKMKHIKPGNSLVLNNVFFDFNKFDLIQESLPELDKLLDFMKTHPHIYIEISGHTDSSGQEAYNLKLSKQRANSVRNYLTNRGIPEKNIRIKGYGESKPVASNGTEEGRKLNRRTECYIYDMDALPEEHLQHLAKTDTANDDDIVLEELMATKKVGEKMYPKVHFLYNNGVFVTEFSKKQMTKVSEALRRVPKMSIEILPCTDKVGTEYNNKALYEKRAQTVLDYFLEQGVDPSRLKVAPYKPSSTPKVDDLNQGDVENRKVEFVLASY
jgi:outer membrane protein OmpA-like peptidoglycan-associated protein/tetratricopeptide (TPR) repeat protein